MTWLDVGNGWRNLYLLSVILQASALGMLFLLKSFPVRKSKAASFLCGVACVPLCEYLWMLLIAMLFPKAPRLLIIGFPPAASGIAILVMLLRRRRLWKQFPSAVRRMAVNAAKINRCTLIAVCFALAMVILLLPPCVRMLSSMDTISGGDSGEYMGLALRWCENRDFSQLLEKEETVGHYRGHSHFPSLELYMSYGLLHTGETMGYPYDKAAFTGIGLLLFFAAAVYAAILIVVCGQKKQWIALGALCFNLVPSLYESAQGAPRDIWRILALLIAVVFFSGTTEKGNLWRYLLKLSGIILLSFTVMSAHVVCFVVLPFIVCAWVIWRWLSALIAKEGHAGKALLRSIGLATGAAVGILAGFSGNLWCYFRWGTLSPFRLMDTFSGTPWYDLYMQKEYKLEETTTTVDFFQNKSSVLMAHATKLGVWGFRLALLALVCGIIWLIAVRFRRRKGLESNGIVNGAVQKALGCALLLLFTLLPVTGLLDTRLYSFSGSFLKMARYTLQWYLLCGAMISAFFASFSSVWPLLCDRIATAFKENRWKEKLIPLLRGLPGLLCVLLCVVAFVGGTSQKGYSESFYRQSRDLVEDETKLLDNSFQSRYSLLMSVMDEVHEDEKLLITRVGYQYPLRSRAYLIAANNIVSILKLEEDEIEDALLGLKVAAVASEPGFWDNRYFGLSTLSDWLHKLPEERIVETETIRIYFVSEELYQRCQPILKSQKKEGP